MALYISNKHNKVSYTPSSEIFSIWKRIKSGRMGVPHPRVLKIEDENRSELRVLMLGQRRKKAYKLCNRASVVSIEFRTNLKHLQHIIASWSWSSLFLRSYSPISYLSDSIKWRQKFSPFSIFLFICSNNISLFIPLFLLVAYYDNIIWTPLKRSLLSTQ